MKKLNARRYTLYALLALSFLGFLDAAYLTIVRYKDVIPPCTIAHGCEKVLTSAYATALGIPLSLWGAIYYLVLGTMVLLLIENFRSRLFFCVIVLTKLSFLASIYLFYLQAQVIGAFCQYCLTAEGINVATFTLVVFLFFAKRNPNSR